MASADPIAGLINQILELTAEQAEFIAKIATLQAALASEALLTADLSEALEEAVAWAEQRPESERLIKRWRLLLSDSTG